MWRTTHRWIRPLLTSLPHIPFHRVTRSAAPQPYPRPLFHGPVPLYAFYATLSSPPSPWIARTSATQVARQHREEEEEEEDDDDDKSGIFDDPDDENGVGGAQPGSPLQDEKLIDDVDVVVSSLLGFGKDGAEARRCLENCGVTPRPELVWEVLSRLRNDWAAAFTFFLWAGKHPGYTHLVREYHCMIAILGKMRRFDTAWALVDEMQRRQPSLVTQKTLLILIRRYCAVHDVAKAINAFYAFKRFGLLAGIEDFQGLLGALCRYKNVEDAEHLLLCNESAFPFETKSFNIVLNGWCNALVNLRGAKRFWREMASRGVERDVVSYGCMISCYSKAGNLRDVLKLFDQMKHSEIVPDRKVYNAVVYALAKGNCIGEAKGVVKTMEEKGIIPNAVTFNSLIRPLCEARRLQDVWILFDELWRRGLSPCIRTYHAFFDTLKTTEEVFEMLDRMKQNRCSPVGDTYIMLIRKLCRWRQHESVFKLWHQMIANGFSPDRSAYVVLVHGLFLNGKLVEASKYYEEMKAKGFLPEPKTDEMLQAWFSGKNAAERTSLAESEDKLTKQQHSDKDNNTTLNTITSRRKFLRKPEERIVTRERGFSFW